jgi:hypothetical protein
MARDSLADHARFWRAGARAYRVDLSVLAVVVMNRRFLWAISALLVGIIAFAFFRPDVMVAPGPVKPTHAAIANDCFACHAPFRSASPVRCVACHKLADIGRSTTKGAPVRHPAKTPVFHQALTEPNCMACHSDHAAPRLTRRTEKPFAHALLKPLIRAQCSACHTPPDTPRHRQNRAQCSTCHSDRAWKPASFDHARYFVLDSNHAVACATCHVGSDYRTFTCYGCHEHQPERIRADHAEEGIGNIENCVRCHRSANGEGGEGRERGGDD